MVNAQALIDKASIDRALAERRVQVRIGGAWWPAHRRSPTRTTGNDWFVVVTAGASRSKRIITNQPDGYVEWEIVE